MNSQFIVLLIYVCVTNKQEMCKWMREKYLLFIQEDGRKEEEFNLFIVVFDR